VIPSDISSGFAGNGNGSRAVSAPVALDLTFGCTHVPQLRAGAFRDLAEFSKDREDASEKEPEQDSVCV
jgi:hypothetical protein